MVIAHALYLESASSPPGANFIQIAIAIPIIVAMPGQLHVLLVVMCIYILASMWSMYVHTIRTVLVVS